MIFQGHQIPGFIVRFAILPAAPEDAYPLECQGTDSHLVGFSFLPLGLVKGPRPEGKAYGLVGPFDESLSQELRTTVTPMHPGLVA